MLTAARTMEQYEVPQTIKTGLPYDPVIPCLGIYPQRNKSTALILKEPHARVHCSIVYKSRDMETTRASTDGRMDGEDVVQIYT